MEKFKGSWKNWFVYHGWLPFNFDAVIKWWKPEMINFIIYSDYNKDNQSKPRLIKERQTKIPILN